MARIKAMGPVRTLVTTQPALGAVALPDNLRTIYDGDLSFPAAPAGRPYLIANFASTLDGVVTFNLPGQSEGKQISGSNEADQFIMGLLRASSDAIVVGSGTFEITGHGTLWFPESIYPPAGDLYQRYRRDVLNKSEQPLLVILSGTGRLDLSRTAFHTEGQRVLIITTEQGKQNLQSGPKASPIVRVTVFPTAQERVNPLAILTLLRQEFDVKLALNEGGPNLFGEFLVSELADELFLTVAPQIAGRNPTHRRLGLVENIEFVPDNAPWWTLLSVKQAADHLFLRYQRNGSIQT